MEILDEDVGKFSSHLSSLFISRPKFVLNPFLAASWKVRRMASAVIKPKKFLSITRQRSAKSYFFSSKGKICSLLSFVLLLQLICPAGL